MVLKLLALQKVLLYPITGFSLTYPSIISSTLFMQSLLSNSQWLRDQLQHFLGIIRDRERDILTLIAMVSEDPDAHNLASTVSTLTHKMRDNSACLYSGIISSPHCCKLLARITQDITRMLQASLRPLKDTCFNYEDIDQRLTALSEELNLMIFNRAVEYSEYLQRILDYIQFKTERVLGMIFLFAEEVRDRQFSSEPLTNALEMLVPKRSDRKRRSSSVNIRSFRLDSERDKDKELSRGDRGVTFGNIYSMYEVAEISKAQFMYNVDFCDETPHKQKMILLISERNRHIKEEINAHLKYTDRIESKIRGLKTQNMLLQCQLGCLKHPPEQAEREGEEEGNFAWAKNEPCLNPERPENQSISPRKKALLYRFLKDTNPNSQLSAITARLQGKPSSTAFHRRITPQRARSYTKINQPSPKHSRDRLLEEPKRKRTREVVGRVSSSSINQTAPVKNLRLKKHVRIGLLKSVKLFLDCP